MEYLYLSGLFNLQGWLMSRTIINNTSRLSDIEAVKLVSDVMGLGFISGDNHYCLCSTWKDIVVLAATTKNGSYSFKVVNSDG